MSWRNAVYGRPTIRRAEPWLQQPSFWAPCFLGGSGSPEQLVGRAFFASNPSSHFFYLITAPTPHLLIGVAGLAGAMLPYLSTPQSSTVWSTAPL